MSAFENILKHIRGESSQVGTVSVKSIATRAGDLFSKAITVIDDCSLFVNPTPTFDGWWRFQIIIKSNQSFTDYSYTHCHNGAVELTCDLLRDPGTGRSRHIAGLSLSIFDAFDEIFKDFQKKQMLVEIDDVDGAIVYALALQHDFGNYTGQIAVHSPIKSGRLKGVVMVKALTAKGCLMAHGMFNKDIVCSTLEAANLFSFDASLVTLDDEQKIYQELKAIIVSRYKEAG